jgi:hypothetical protein
VNETIQSKSAVTSTSTWGFVIAALPLLLGLMGLNPTAADTAAVTDAVRHGETIYASAMAIVGTIMLFVGRYNARQPIHFLAPYEISAVTGRKIVADIPASFAKTRPLPPPPGSSGSFVNPPGVAQG